MGLCLNIFVCTGMFPAVKAFAGNRCSFWRGNAIFLIQASPQLITFCFHCKLLTGIFDNIFLQFSNFCRLLFRVKISFLLPDENYPSSDYPQRKSPLWPIFSREIFSQFWPKNLFWWKIQGCGGKDGFPQKCNNASTNHSWPDIKGNADTIRG